MACRDIEARRRYERARFHRRVAARRAAGLCLRCGKVPPAPERTLCESCNDKQNRASRARDARLRAEGKPRRDPAKAKLYESERRRRVYAERVAARLCTKCGRTEAVPERTTCEPCAEKSRARDRARHARARAEGLPYGGRDPEAKRKSGRASSRRRAEARQAAGLCIRCGHNPPEEGRSMCEPCRDSRREAARARHRQRRAAGLCVKCSAPAPDGKTYCRPCAVAKEGRRDLKAKREADRRRYAERKARGDCGTCGKPSDGAAECEDCRAAARARYNARRAAGVCVKCRTPTFGGRTYCAACAVAKEKRRDREAEYAAKRRRYADRRARGRCVECEAPSPGVARCEPCSRRHREGSGAFRGIPVWDPSWTVIEIASGRELGTYDSEADVALCLAFGKLARHEVEIVADISPMAIHTAPPW
ncbi:MAG: hypothetical protein OXH87_00760 [Rhodospirillaceae bacterium]|nr:hypothetical protein [Rhodospirillaceae bacterium]